MRLVLDEHVSPELATALQQAGLDAVAIQNWRGGALLSAPDDQILAAAAEEERILLTSDRSSMTTLAQERNEGGRSHAGIVFLRSTETQEARIGDVTRRIVRLEEDLADVDWTDRILYLPPDRPTPPSA